MNWMTAEEDLWEVREYFRLEPHSRIRPSESDGAWIAG
jgi:hypothetical protein